MPLGAAGNYLEKFAVTFWKGTFAATAPLPSPSLQTPPRGGGGAASQRTGDRNALHTSIGGGLYSSRASQEPQMTCLACVIECFDRLKHNTAQQRCYVHIRILCDIVRNSYSSPNMPSFPSRWIAGCTCGCTGWLDHWSAAVANLSTPGSNLNGRYGEWHGRGRCRGRSSCRGMGEQ